MKTTVTNRSRPYFVLAAGALHLLAGALLSCGVAAQSSDELGRLIFEVAAIPPETDEPAGPGGAGTGAPDGLGTGTPSADLDPAPVNLSADINAYRARIADILANDNPYASALREQYDALGSALQQSGDHEAAIVAFESAMHIDRVNGGLYTLDQIPLVEKITASHDALGNIEDVNNFHEYLFYIQQKTYDDGDPRLLLAQEEWADWNVESWLQERARNPGSLNFETSAGTQSRLDYVAVQDPRSRSFVYIPRMHLLSAMSPMSNGSFVDPMFMSTYGVDAERVIDERLRTARTYYEDIVEAKEIGSDANVVENGARTGTDSESIAEAHRVQHKLASVAYAIKEQLSEIDTISDPTSAFSSLSANYSLPPTVTRSYARNRDMLEAIAQEVEQDPAATAVEKAQAWIHLGDWHTGFDYAQRGAEAYRKAWDLLSAAGLSQTEIDAVLMPKPLVPAPVFVIHRYSREAVGIAPDANIGYKGYLDLTLNVSRYGDVSGIDIEVAVPVASQVLRSELIDYLRAQKMRPALAAGETVKRENLRLRYYYSY